MGAIIKGTGSFMPKHVIKNDYFENFAFYDKKGMPIDKPGKAIVEKLEAISGIKERRFIGEDEYSIDILTKAAERAIADAGIDANELDAIIIGHNSGNMLAHKKDVFSTVPNLGALLKNRLNITNYECVSYDILFGCPGWVQGSIQANRLINTGEAKHVLVCGVEVISRLLDPHDMDSMLMGDGCGATVYSASDDKTEGVLSTAVFSHAMSDVNSITLGCSLNANIDGDIYFKMNGRDVYRYATTWVPKVIQKALDKVGLTPKDIDLFFFHQANAKMLDAIALNLMKLYGQEKEPYSHKIPSCIEFTGNTSVATVPSLLDFVNKGQYEDFELVKGQKYVFASVGAGMHCNAFVYQN